MQRRNNSGNHKRQPIAISPCLYNTSSQNKTHQINALNTIAATPDDHKGWCPAP